MCDIYKHALTSTAHKQFDDDLIGWQLQEDNDPKHRSKLAKQWKIDHNVNVIDWPSCSPDIAPIENVWQVIKKKLRKNKFTDYNSLVSAIKREWKSLPLDLATKLTHSMKNRVSEVIESDGDFILR